MRRCIVCGHEIFRKWARTCSLLCQQTVKRESKRRHRRWRHDRRHTNPVYLAKLRRRWKRKDELRRARRHADPAWQAWRAGVEERKHEREKLEERRRVWRANADERKRQSKERRKLRKK